jgi:hypothetical protein
VIEPRSARTRRGCRAPLTTGPKEQSHAPSPHPPRPPGRRRRVRSRGRHGGQPRRITSTNLGADDTVVASCDSNGVTSSYTSAYATTPTAGFEVDDVTVAGIDDACDGDTMTVTLTGAGDAALGEVTQAVPVNAAFTNVLDFSGEDVLAEAVTGVHVVITG